jgi:hypothetical protein
VPGGFIGVAVEMRKESKEGGTILEAIVTRVSAKTPLPLRVPSTTL